MAIKEILSALRFRGHSDSSGQPVYAKLPTTPTTPAKSSQSDLSETDNLDSAATPISSACSFRLPTLSRFFADFTLGFADGLTVPFALTAGLSSLGQTDTVIYAGMAEICAGSISMGLGGYLAAKGDNVASKRSNIPLNAAEEEDVDEEKAELVQANEMVEDYLSPLRLSEDLLEAVRAHVQSQSSIATALQARVESGEGGVQNRSFSPILVGLSVSLGYLLGGLLPLFPYFFVRQVSNGLRWSFLVCIVALFAFGFTKHYLLQECEYEGQWRQRNSKRSALHWRRIMRSIWEGTQMVILGSLAAGAAVLCINAFEGFKSEA